MREESNPYGCVAIHARLNLLFGRSVATAPRDSSCYEEFENKKKGMVAHATMPKGEGSTRGPKPSCTQHASKHSSSEWL